ncbi:iron chaperone [Halobacillus massiliensis]|uniref:iron chaperone n=1 Tax=Halobacillus massiliensis TaxID=1926286 RepID=UPI0009E1F2D2|nr:DUF1801 domain-containing protein [Halobacillus massiliensis]
MQFEVSSPQEYFNALDDDWRKEKLLIVREWILKYGPELKEGIQYKMLSYGGGSAPLFHLNAQKNYVSLYVGDIEKIEKAKEFLTGLDYGKGCIRIKKSVDVKESGLEDFIKQTIDSSRAGGDTSC